MSAIEDVRQLLGELLELGARTNLIKADTQLLGNIPELDSMAVVAIISELEERFDIVIEDDEIHAENFETLGSLASFVELKRVA